jgi:hypothetical protein
MVGTVIAIPSYSIQDDYEVQKIMYHSIKNGLVNNKACKLITKNHKDTTTGLLLQKFRKNMKIIPSCFKWYKINISQPQNYIQLCHT